MSYSDDETTTYSYEDEEDVPTMATLKKDIYLLIVHNINEVEKAGREDNTRAKLYQELRMRLARLEIEYQIFNEMDTEQ